MLEEMAARGAAILASSFDQYRRSFREITARAPGRFARCEWHAMHEDALERLGVYRKVLDAAVEELRRQLAEDVREKPVWTAMKEAFVPRISGRGDVELAETFFSSASRRVFTTVGVDPAVEFVAPESVAMLRVPGAPVYASYRPEGETAAVLSRLLSERALEAPFEDLERDARLAAGALEARLGGPLSAAEALHVVRPVFYRNKGAYVVGRILRGAEVVPLVFALTNPGGRVVVDAVLTETDDVSQVFSFTRSYFHVDVAQPWELVRFLRSLLPQKPVSELYIAIGHNKHGKTELYRDLLRYLATTDEPFVLAPGEEGMVMAVFTMPSLDVVFKVIKDSFGYPKTSSRADVMEKYRLVFRHDRAGRLVDVQEFEHLEFDRQRFAESLLERLLKTSSESVSTDGERVEIRHLYTERRIVPLNLYLASAPEAKAVEAVLEFGQALKDLAATNVFPGDLLLKNFGVTRHGRVVFYDYDELCSLTSCSFRELPEAEDESDEGGEAWFYVGENDVFPEEFPRFLGLRGPLRKAFLDAHGDLFTPRFWTDMQARILAGDFPDFFPYPPSRRLHAGA
ncbi:MAG: bifunctional isocitrate dehydrogenase kinase/phosphatase [Acidobacteria bacterium]|nr:MAG: bifunctional isocitrate dehydrogenase kinase/phosphatase [Acidobacteriota bacterium]MCE7958097.1 bifunctional isocitrate dehydrogenase kinase/phosphatase [Acidobacteria bacterium ACB2]